MRMLAILAMLAAGQAPAELSREKFDAIRTVIKPEAGKQHLRHERLFPRGKVKVAFSISGEAGSSLSRGP